MVIAMVGDGLMRLSAAETGTFIGPCDFLLTQRLCGDPGKIASGWRAAGGQPISEGL
jgi:hypothetical protein